jgi:hypothetical protein
MKAKKIPQLISNILIKNLPQFSMRSIMFIVVFIFLIIVLGNISDNKKLNLGQTFINKAEPTLTLTPTPSITESPTVTEEPTPTPSEIPTPTVTYTPTPTKDPDPIVTCSINEKCGGGSELLKNSACNNSTCCQIGSMWIYYLDKNKCLKDQESYNKSLTPTPTLTPTFTPTPTIDPYCLTLSTNWKQLEQNLLNQNIYHYTDQNQELQTLYFYLNAYQKQANLHNCNIKLTI